MLDFFLNYPIGHYIKGMVSPGKRPIKAGLYLSQEDGMILVKDKSKLLYWNADVQSLAGAPTMEITRSKALEKVGNKIPSQWKKEVVSRYKLDSSGQLSIIIEDPAIYTTPFSVSTFETAGELEAALNRDPSTIISSWKSYSQNPDYVWEIMSLGTHILRDNVKLPKKVILCGFPEERAIQTSRWAASSGMELVNIFPLMPALLRWGIETGPQEGFFLLVSTSDEIAIIYIENKEVRIFSPQKTKEGFTPDETADVDELAEEMGKGTDATIWAWGISTSSNAHVKLQARYKNYKVISAEELRAIQPLDIATGEMDLAAKEAWLLNTIIG